MRLPRHKYHEAHSLHASARLRDNQPEVRPFVYIRNMLSARTDTRLRDPWTAYENGGWPPTGVCPALVPTGTSISLSRRFELFCSSSSAQLAIDYMRNPHRAMHKPKAALASSIIGVCRVAS